MKPKKHNLLLIVGFAFLILLIIVISFKGATALINDNKMFTYTYVQILPVELEVEEANSDLIAVHRAMKDVALSTDEKQLEAAMENVGKYDSSFRLHLDFLNSFATYRAFSNKILEAYDAWAPIRAQTIKYMKEGKFNEASKNTKTAGANQVKLVQGEIEALINTTKVDANKFHQTSIQRSSDSFYILVFLTVIAILLAIIVSVYIRKKVTNYENELHDEKERLRITLKSIGDGVITTDMNGEILLLNTCAEDLTGWEKEQAKGRKFEEVFIISSAITGRTAKNPVEEVLRTDQICELENHTILTSKDGYLRHISDSAAPIKDHKGKTFGVVIVFRDVTERKIVEEQLHSSEEHYRMLFNSMLNGYSLHKMIFDENGVPCDYEFIDVNPAFEEMTGIRKIDCIGRTVMELMPQTESYWMEIYGKVVITGEPIRYENFSREIGKYFEVYAFSPMQDHFAVLIMDVTEKKKLDNILFDEKERLRITLDSIGDGVITTDTNKNVQILNKMAEYFTGWNMEDAHGKKFEEVFDITSAITGEKAKDPVEEVLTTDEICELANHTILTSADGITQRHIADSAAPIKDRNGKTTGVVMVFRDVTEKKKDMDRIRFLSYHDGLTGLYNRAYFENELQLLSQQPVLPISVIIGDVNGLKLLNDVYGHKAGDELLKCISIILKKACGEKGVVARWGGDEFAILLPNTSSHDANKICCDINTACHETDFKPIILSISLGVSTKTDPSSDLNVVLKDAEDRMYTNKLVEGKSARSTIISSLQKTLFEKSCETEEHANRMIKTAIEFGLMINLTEYEMDEMRLLTLLHDVGKIGISDSILNKPSSLLPEEWYEMKKHPEIGYRIAQSTTELSHIAELILTHHESWDGKGYPQGLSGEGIPKLSRVLSIIDTYDVMTHDRPYRKSVSEKEALEEIKRCSGSQFDPNLVDIFLKIKCQR